MKLIKKFTLFFAAAILAKLKYATEVADNGIQKSREQSSKNRPFYGDQSHPAKNCGEIFKQMPNLPSGVYWLDVFDSQNNRTVQERHYCQNTFRNETRTGYKHKGQQGEIAVENLSLGKPMPAPFDWEELTGENWPLPIIPPTEEEMRQRLQKQMQEYRIKMKSQNPGKFGSSLTNDSRNTEQDALLDNKTLHNSALQDGGEQANVALVQTIEGEHLTTFKENKPTGFIQSDNSLIGSFAKNGRIMNKKDVQHNSVETAQDINPIKSETSQSWSKENPVNYTSQELNDSKYTPYQLSRDVQSANGSQSMKDNIHSLYYNLQNPDYLNIRKDNPGSPSPTQNLSNQETAFRHGNNSTSAFTSDDTISSKLFYSPIDKSSKNANNSNIQGLVKQEMKQQNFSESLGYDLNNSAKLENQSYSASGALTNNGSIITDNPKSDQSRIADYYNSTTAASSSYESFDRNQEYNSNRSFNILTDGLNLHQNWSDANLPTDALTSPVDNSRYVNRSSFDAMNETTVQIGAGLNGKQTPQNLTAWYRATAGSNSSRLRNVSLITSPYPSTDNLRPDFYLNQEKATNDSFNNGSYVPASSQGNSSFGASIIFINETSAQLSNLKSDQNRNLGYTYLNNSVDEIANASTADTIRSNQYWNPGYENKVDKQPNESSSKSDEIRSDLYWNPGYANNRSFNLQSNESKLNPQSYYLQLLNLYWNRSSVLEIFDHSTNGTADALRIGKKNYSSSNVVVVVNSPSTNRSEDAALPYYNTFNRSTNATSSNYKSNEGDSAGIQSISASIYGASAENQSVYAINHTISTSNESDSAGIQSISASICGASAENQSVSAINHTISTSNESDSAGFQSISASIYGASAGNQSVYAINHTISTSNESDSAGIQSISASIYGASAGNQSVSAINHTISTSNESNSAGIQSISASIYGASAENQNAHTSNTTASNERAYGGIQSISVGDENVVTSSRNLSAPSDNMPAGTQSVSAGNRSISAGSIYGISSYNIGNTSGSANTSTIDGAKVQSNATAMANESDSPFYKQTNDTSKAAAIARTEIIGRRHNLLPEKHENPSHSRVRMILKNWSKVTNSDNAEDKIMNKNTAKGATTEKDVSLAKKNGAAGKDISNKDLERDGLFVKPGLNIGVIETTKDLKNESKRKDTVVRSKNKPTGIPVNVVAISAQSSPDSKRTVVSHSDNPTVGEKIPEDAPVYTGQVTDISPSAAGDPVKKPNPDELHRGLWTDEAIKYTEKVNEDFAKHMKYLKQHGGNMDDLIWEYNKLNRNKQATRDPKRADDTKEKMKDFFARNKEIVSKGGGLQIESSENKEDNSVPNDGKQYMQVSGLDTDKDDPVHKPDSSLQLGLSSTASSEAGSESQTEAWADVGANTESLTGIGGDSEPAEEEFEGGNPQWDNTDEPSYEEYDRPQGLGLWTDSDTGTGVGISTGPDDGTNPDAESEYGSKESSKNSWPGFGFSTGFGMGTNAGSQSGSETMTETSVAINTGTSAETSSKTNSESEASSGSKYKSKYKWKMGPKINSSNEQTNGYTEKSNDKVHQGNMNTNEITRTAGGGDSDVPVIPIPQTLKEKATFKPNPQLGIQVDSNVNTKVQASASAKTASGNSSGRKKKPKSKPKTAARIGMEKAQAHLKEQMKKFKEDLEAKTRDNPLHRWKLFGKTPLQGRLEAIAEKTRNIPLGIRVGETKGKETGTGNGKDVHKDANKVEASVDIKYEGKNANGVNIEAGVNTNIGGGGGLPKNDTLKDIKGIKNYKKKKNWRTLYRWYEKYPFNIPSVAEINKKLNSMPYALYKARMRKFGKSDV